MTRGDEDIEGGGGFDTRMGGLWKNCWARRGAWKICILQNQQEGGLQNFLDTRKGDSEKIRGGGSENVYTLKPTGRGRS